MQDILYTEKAVGRTFYSYTHALEGTLRGVKIIEVGNNFFRYESDGAIGTMRKGFETMILVPRKIAEDRIARYKRFFKN